MILCKGCTRRHICKDFSAIRNVQGKLELVYCDNYKKEEWSELKKLNGYELQEQPKIQN